MPWNYTSFIRQSECLDWVLKKRKKRLSDILFGSLFSAVLQIMYRTFPIRAYADRENTAHLPTERIRQKQRCRKRFSVACGIKSFNSLSWRSGFGGMQEERKGEICFWKIFCRNRASETAFCSFAYLYGKKRQNVTRNPFVLQKVYKPRASTGKNNGAIRNLRLLQPHYNWKLYLPHAFSICIRRFCFTLNARTKTIQNAEW